MRFHLYSVAMLAALATNAGLAMASDLDIPAAPPPVMAPPVEPPMEGPPPMTVPPPPPSVQTGGYFGNAHLILGADANTGFNTFKPFVGGGGKFAYDGGVGSFGYQADVDFWYNDLSWYLGTTTTQTGNNWWLDAAAHLTYQITDEQKLGAFISYSMLNNTRNAGTGPLINGLYTSTNGTLGFAGLGAEGLWAFSNDTTAQVRGAFITQILSNGSNNTGLASTSTGNGFQLNFSNIGGAAEIGLNHRLDNNFTLHGDLGVRYLTKGINTGTNTAAEWDYGALAGIDYIFDGLPLCVGLQGGYEAPLGNAANGNQFTLGAKLTYSFGTVSQGATGKLFRSGLFSYEY